jgi:uncharacterized membrane protein
MENTQTRFRNSTGSVPASAGMSVSSNGISSAAPAKVVVQKRSKGVDYLGMLTIIVFVGICIILCKKLMNRIFNPSHLSF